MNELPENVDRQLTAMLASARSEYTEMPPPFIESTLRREFQSGHRIPAWPLVLGDGFGHFNGSRGGGGAAAIQHGSNGDACGENGFESRPVGSSQHAGHSRGASETNERSKTLGPGPSPRTKQNKRPRNHRWFHGHSLHRFRTGG